MANIKDVANAAGVSVATVSRVLNGTAEVTKERYNKVVSCAEELGYTLPPRSANAARTTRKSFLVVLPNKINSFYSDVITGLTDAAYSNDIDLLLGVCFNNIDIEINLLTKLYDRVVQGAVFLGTFLREEEIRKLNENYCIALCCEEMKRTNVLTVAIDMEAAAYEAVSYLISLGHKRIGMVSSYTRMTSSLAKEKGYKRALADHGLPYSDKDIFLAHMTDFNSNEAYEYFEKLDTLPSAYFCISDVLAVEMIKALTSRGFTIGKDVDVAGFDGASDMPYSLTTVAQPSYYIGYKTIELMLDNLGKHHDEKNNSTVYLPHKLIIGNSTKDPQ